MKKILIVTVCLVMLFSVSAFGESGFSELSTSELIETYDELYAEILRRLSDASIARGQYVVGEDIAPGKYEFTCIHAKENQNAYSCITVYKILHPENFTKQQYYGMDEKFEEYYYSGPVAVGDKVSFSLDNNMILELRLCDGILTSPSHTWAP